MLDRSTFERGQSFINFHKPRPRHNALCRYTAVASAETVEQCIIDTVQLRKIDMPAFGSLNMITVALAPDSWTYRIAEGAQARFVPDDAAAPSRQARVTRIAPASDGRLAEPALADRYGGGVAVGERKGELALRSGWIELQLSVEGAPPPSIQRGVMWIEASPVSPAAMLWQRLARIFVREQTF